MVNILDMIGDKPVAKKTTKKAGKKEVQVKECMEQVHLVIQMGNASPMTVRFSNAEEAYTVYGTIKKLWHNRTQLPRQRFFEFTNDYGMFMVDMNALTYLAIADLSAIHSMRSFQLPA